MGRGQVWWVMERHTPIDGSLVGVYPRGGREDVDAAVAAARAAFDGGIR